MTQCWVNGMCICINEALPGHSLTQSLSLSLSLSVDEDECRYGNQCHECVNYPGGFECMCRDGYYHSPAAGTCYGEFSQLFKRVQLNN